MAAPSPRLVEKIRQSFPPTRADEVIALLGSLPETSQSAERVQAAMVARSRGDFTLFTAEMELVQVDWRDTLMHSGFEHSDWEQQLDQWLGPEQ